MLSSYCQDRILESSLMDKGFRIQELRVVGEGRGCCEDGVGMTAGLKDRRA